MPTAWVEIEGARELAKDLDEIPRKMVLEMKAAMQESLQRIQSLAKARVPRDTGKLASRIEPPWIKTAAGVTTGEVVVGTRIGHLVEYGTGLPAGHGRHWPAPRGVRLTAWAQARGLKVRDVAYWIGRRGGTRARPFFGPAWEAEKGPAMARFEETFRRVLEQWGR